MAARLHHLHDADEMCASLHSRLHADGMAASPHYLRRARDGMAVLRSRRAPIQLGADEHRSLSSAP